MATVRAQLLDPTVAGDEAALLMVDLRSMQDTLRRMVLSVRTGSDRIRCRLRL